MVLSFHPEIPSGLNYRSGENMGTRETGQSWGAIPFMHPTLHPTSFLVEHLSSAMFEGELLLFHMEKNILSLDSHNPCGGGIPGPDIAGKIALLFDSWTCRIPLARG